MHIRPSTSAELDWIEATRRAYRAMWGKLKSVRRCGFEGGREDIEALDFIDYEAGSHPEGLAGAAVIWGGVLAATGVVSWAIGDEQHFVLVSDSECPRALVFPYARVAEIHCSSWPQFGKYEWLLEEAVLRLCAQGLDVERKLRDLLRDRSDGFVAWSRRWPATEG